MKSFNLRLAVSLALTAVAVLPLVATRASGAQAQDEAETYTVRAGAGEPGYMVNEFLAQHIYIEPGDTVKWTFPWFEPHSVTIGAPTGNIEEPTHPGQDVVDFDGAEFVNSALVFGNPETPPAFSIKFNKAGTYDYYCYIHPGMTGTVTVLGPGQGVQDEQVAIDARGNNEYNSAITSLKNVAAGLAAKPVAVTPKQGGGKKYTLSAGADTPEGVAAQFFPAVINIAVNDSIEWVADTHSPHTVSFGQPPAELMGPAIFGAPAMKPAATYDGTGFWHSGVIGLDMPSGQKFEMTFSKPGSYTYACALHAQQGHVGVVNVAGQSAPGAPNTGTGIHSNASPEHAGGSSGLWLIGGVVALAALLTGTTIFAAKR